MYFLFFVLCRVLLLLWGINKFTKKLIRPWAINNNELVDFISRVPDNEELVIKGTGSREKIQICCHCRFPCGNGENLWEK
jgi:hypothetical protein